MTDVKGVLSALLSLKKYSEPSMSVEPEICLRLGKQAGHPGAPRKTL